MTTNSLIDKETKEFDTWYGNNGLVYNNDVRNMAIRTLKWIYGVKYEK